MRPRCLIHASYLSQTFPFCIVYRHLQVPLLAEYAASLRTKIIQGVDHPAHRDTPLKGLKIVVDAGNGSGGFFADQVRSRVRGQGGWELTRQEFKDGWEWTGRVENSCAGVTSWLTCCVCQGVCSTLCLRAWCSHALQPCGQP